MMAVLLGVFAGSANAQSRLEELPAKNGTQYFVDYTLRPPKPVVEIAIGAVYGQFMIDMMVAESEARIGQMMREEQRYLTLAPDGADEEPSPDAQSGKDSNASKDACGNPIQIVSGNKVEVDQDFATVHDFGLALTRTYNGNTGTSGMFGPRWSTPFDIRAEMGAADSSGFPGTIRLLRSDGSSFVMIRSASDGKWYRQGINDAYAYIARDANGQYVYYDPSGRIEVYAAGGSVLRVSNPQGVSWTFVYGNPNAAVTALLPNPTLQKVVHGSGRSASFVWKQQGGIWVIDYITSPSGGIYVYGYTSDGILSTVTYPRTYKNTHGELQQDVLTYHQIAPGLLGGKSFNGVRYSTFSYDGAGRGTSSEHANGVERYVFSRSGNQTTVTSPLGLKTTYTADDAGDIVSTSQTASVYCPATASSVVKDLANFRRLDTDLDGSQTEITTDAAGNVIKLVRAFGTSLAHQTTYTWDAYPRRMRTMRTPTRLTEYTFTDTNQVKSITVTNLTSNGTPLQALTTSYSYVDSNGDGLPESITIDGPVAGSSDAVTYRYSAGELTEVAGPSGSVYYSGHTGAGQPTAVSGLNVLTTSYIYDARDRVYAVTSGGISSYFAYDSQGQIISRQDAGQWPVDYTYDAARRLTQIISKESYPADASGVDGTTLPVESRVVFGMDVASNVTSTSVTQTHTEYVSLCGTAPDCTVDDMQLVTTTGTYKSTFADFDELNRLRKLRGNAGQSLTYTYTSGGQVKTVTDANGNVLATNFYDALKRLIQTNDAKGGQTLYGYDADGRLSSVKDPKGNTTSYTYDGLGQLWKTVSPDTGTTTRSYNGAGQLLTASSADGKTLTFSYRADGRLGSMAATRGAQNQTISYDYDTCTNGKGRLCSVVSSNGERVDYSYTVLGQVASQSNTIMGTVLTTSWTYNPTTGQVATMRYPNGTSLEYGWADGYLRSIFATVNNVRKRIVDQAMYQPAGPLSGFVDANGQAKLRQFDLDGRVRTLSSPTQNWTFSYDARDLISGISGSDQISMGYDELGRLTSATQTGLNAGYGYDANGNRIKATYSTSPALPVSYTVPATNNKVTAVAWNGTTRTMGYDGAGNLVRDQRSATQTDCHQYDAFGRLAVLARYSAAVSNCATVTLTPASSSQYRSNGLNQRSYKSAAGRQTRFVYGLDGELLYEVSAPASSYSEKTYVWFGGEVVALVSAGAVFTVQNDQVGRPLSVQDANRSTVWSARVRAFDRTVLTDQIGGFNIGYPGQYVDAESGLNYNWNRYYEPSLGRYTQSDPIGLAGGINTYAYASGNPTRFVDPSGLDIVVITGGVRDGSINLAGHIAVGVTGAGVFSYGNDTQLGSSVTAYIGSPSAIGNQTVTIIPTTAAQDAAALAYLKGQLGMNSVGLVNNCAVRSNSVLGAAGINISATPFPGSVARGAMGLPGAQNFFVPQGGAMPGGLVDALRQFTPPNVP